MTIYASMIHTANIKRAGHAIVARKKVTSETTIATNVECRITPAGDAASISVLGRTASETYTGFFPAGTDVRIGDKVVWLDRTPNLVFMVEGDMGFGSGAYQDQDHHLELTLKRMAVE